MLFLPPTVGDQGQTPQVSTPSFVGSVARPSNPCRRMAPLCSSLTQRVVVPPRRHAKLGTPRPRPDGRMTRRRFVGRYRCSRLALAPATILGGQGPLLWAFSLCPPIQCRASFCHLGQAIYRSPRLAIQVSAHPSCWCHALIEYITRDSPHHRPPTHHLPSDILITYRCKLGPYGFIPLPRTVHPQSIKDTTAIQNLVVSSSHHRTLKHSADPRHCQRIT